jgi:tetratricopeptide (TPR) repeat protein
MKTFVWIALLSCGLLAPPARAVLEMEPFEQLIQQGKPEEAMTLLAKELARRPNNLRLLYNYGVAAYAAKRYDEALLSFDRVEAAGGGALMEKARAQKGNAEFHLGLDAKASNLDETIERWKTSLAHYRAVLKDSPGEAMAKTNHDIVEKLLMDLLLKSAQKHMDNAHQSWMHSEPKIEELRQAMEKFQEATRVDEKNEQAQQGEKQARQELAQELARTGEKQAQRKPDQPLEHQVREMEKGVNKLEDANRLLPEDKPIEQKLDQARQNLADALTELARKEIDQAKASQWDNEKFNKLDQAVENAQKALEQKPEHPEAQQAMEQAKEELAKLHEKRGDNEVKDASWSQLPQAANKLEAALEDYKASNELKENTQVQAKAIETEKKLEDTLQKLADKMMKDPAKETLDERAARFETAQQALQDLEQLNPTEKTENQLDEATRKLAETREQLAEQARREQAQRPQQAQQSPQQDQKRPQLNPQNQAQADFEKMPHMQQQPLGKGDFKSDNMKKNTRDY